MHFSRVFKIRCGVLFAIPVQVMLSVIWKIGSKHLKRCAERAEDKIKGFEAQSQHFVGVGQSETMMLYSQTAQESCSDQSGGGQTLKTFKTSLRPNLRKRQFNEKTHRYP